MKRLLLKLLFSAVLLGLLFWRTPLQEIARNVHLFDPMTLLTAGAMSLAAWWLSAARLWCLLPGFRLGDLVRATFVGLFYGTVLPGQLSGDVVKAYRLSYRSERPGHAAAATLVDRVLSILAMFSLGAAGAASTPHAPPMLRLLMTTGAAVIAIGCMLAALVPVHALLRGRHAESPGRPLWRFLRHFTIAAHECLRSPWRVFASLVLALLFHALCLAIQMVLGATLNISLSWADWTSVYAGVSLIVLMPFSIAGIGLREGGYVGLLAIFGVNAGQALTLSFAVFALTLLGAAIGAVLELTASQALWHRKMGQGHESE